MSAAWVWISTVLLSFLVFHVTASPSRQKCDEPFRVTITVVTNTTYLNGVSFVDADNVFYKEVLRFTDEEIDREREAAIQFFRSNYGLNFTNVEVDEQGQRILGNATFQPVLFPTNDTYVFNSWVVNGKTRTRCFRSRKGGFQVLFNGTGMLHGEYGGEEGSMAFSDEVLFYGRQYVYDVCEQQGILFQLESITPNRLEQSDAWLVVNYRVRNRMLGEGVLWGLYRFTYLDLTSRLETRQVITFL